MALRTADEASTEHPFALAAADDVLVFDHDPDLAAGLEPRVADVLRRRLTAPRLRVSCGPWAPPEPGRDIAPAIALLVLDGVLLRTTTLAGRSCPELLGPGDLIRPWQPDPSEATGIDASWSALESSTLAVLDHRFTSVSCRHPSIASALLERGVARTRRLEHAMAIAHIRHAETRVLLTLWQLAGRWGRVTPDGVHLPLRLTHELIAQLAYMRRPTGSSTLTRLAVTGEVVRREDRTWLLTGTPPQVIADDAEVGEQAVA